MYALHTYKPTTYQIHRLPEQHTERQGAAYAAAYAAANHTYNVRITYIYEKKFNIKKYKNELHTQGFRG